MSGDFPNCPRRGGTIQSMDRKPISRVVELIAKKPFYDYISLFGHLLYRLKAELFYRFVFKALGQRVKIEKGWISHPQYIRIGNRVTIRRGTRLEAVVSDPTHPPEIRIGDDVNIEQDVHIVCHRRVIIGNNVSITGRCAIVDVTHPYEDLTAGKIGDLIDSDDSFVEIGDGAFLGYGSIILPNVRVGRRAVIGANSVVTRDVPEFSVVAGAPARVIKAYSHESRRWVKQSVQTEEEPSS